MDPHRRMLLAARARITEVTPEAANLESSVVVDIREPHELDVGVLPGAHIVPLRSLTAAVGELAHPDTPILLYCAVGERSAIAAAILEDHGYKHVVSLAGGIRRWMAEDRPTISTTHLTADQRHRYARHIVLPEVGAKGQQQLIGSRVAIIGAGGLGSPAAMYLAAAGVGTLGIIDNDRVDLSNLQRQILHGNPDIGLEKSESAGDTIAKLNPEVAVVTHSARLSSANAEELLTGYDVIVDGTDNLATRYLLNDVSLRLRVPVVHGSVFRFEGQVSVFQPYEGPCYRCLFPEPPPPELAPNCAETGVFGVLPGVIGTMQATETLKLLLGVGTPLIGKLLTYDALEQTTLTVRLRRDPNCSSCGDETSPPRLRDEQEYC
jgi:molybdopterin/thiamine biosynthesis adenylyltransferase/rhodanese-related sulfurtransferase